MIKHVGVFILIIIPFLSFCQEITEANYLKVDSEIWTTLEQEGARIQKLLELYPEKQDSLINLYEQADQFAEKRNRDAAIKFASVPSGLQRLFMLRLVIPKDTLRTIFNSLPQEMQRSEYGQSMLMHLNENQLEFGDPYFAFEAVNANGEKTRLSDVKSENILLLYGGMYCMRESGRDFLKKIYNQTTRDNLQIIIYFNTTSNLDQLKAKKKEYPFNYIYVSDFLGDHSSVKIIYGTQATPTSFWINNERTIILKENGLPIDELTKLVENLK